MAKRTWHWGYQLRDINVTTWKKYWRRVRVYDPPSESKEGQLPAGGVNAGGKERGGFFPVRQIDMIIHGEEKKENDSGDGGGEDKG